MIIDKEPTTEFNETIALDFTNITEEQKQELIKLLSKTRIQAIDKDVIWQNGYDTCLNDKSIRESNWIPVSERLPDKNGRYLITQGDARFKTIIIKYYDLGKKEFGTWHELPFDDEEVWISISDVIAWQPLPEPYKEEAEND